MSDDIGVPHNADSGVVLAPFIKDGPLLAARVSESAYHGAIYRNDGIYYAKDDETPAKIAKLFAADLEKLVEINKKNWPDLLQNSKLKGGTKITLPPRDLKWMLTKQVGSSVKVDKKKMFDVQDIVHDSDGNLKLYQRVESKFIQKYPQLENKYMKGEIVCALWPQEDDQVIKHDPGNDSYWFTEFYKAQYINDIDRDMAKLKYENDANSLDHNELDKIRVVPKFVIIKREKMDKKGAGSETSEIHIIDPKYEGLGKRKFLWDSMTKQWHDSLHYNRSVHFRITEPSENYTSGAAGTAGGLPEINVMDIDETRAQTPPPSPPRYTEDDIVQRCKQGTEGAQALDMFEMTLDTPGQSWQSAAEAGTDEEREQAKLKPHMAWWYLDGGGRVRNWTATRQIDALREPAPYVVLW